jgi:hypothetical protein
MEDICRLCNRHESLKNSHVLPAFVFKWLKKDGFIRHSPSINRRAQDGAKEEWLCSECEGLLNGWETRFANSIFHPSNDGGLPVISYGEWLLKFCTSVSWRSLLYVRQKTGLASFSPDQLRHAGQAQKIWAEFLRGERPHPGEFEQHLIPFGPVNKKIGTTFPPNINRYLLRGVETDVARGPSTIFVFSKLGRLAVLGFICLRKPSHWVGSKIKLRGGNIKRREYVFPAQFGDYLSKRATRAWDATDKMSTTQQQKVDATIRSNVDRYANSDMHKTMAHDVRLFGSEAFHKRN